MKIEFITPEEYNILNNIFENNKNLFLQNTGYEGIDKRKFTEADKDDFKKVTEILSKSVYGFSSFQNFRNSKKTGKPELRFQYNYGYDGGHSFVGVGYILLDELLNGFTPKN